MVNKVTDHEALADNHWHEAELKISVRETKTWPAQASQKDKDRWLAKINQDINENLALAQVHASLAALHPKKTAPGVTDAIDFGKAAEFFKGFMTP